MKLFLIKNIVRLGAFMLMLLPLTPVQAQNEKEEDLDAQYATELLKPGQQAPDFALRSPMGKVYKLSDYKGKYVVLDFWASWCPDCIKELPEMRRMYQEFAKKGVVFIGVSGDHDKKAWTDAIKKHQVNYIHVSELKKWKKETRISALYQVKWIPSMYLIDKQGKVVLGTVVSQKLQKALEEVTQ